ncbi:CCHC-type domain-containing protein [Trichonephila clavipes]|nr:CCHC-type domain-containing protein [Trichonephila clavipes]
MKEDEKVSHLMKGVAEDIYQALLTREINDTASFIKWCNYIEDMKQKRVGRPRFERLPNVVPKRSFKTKLKGFWPQCQQNLQKLRPRPTYAAVTRKYRAPVQKFPPEPRKTDVWRTADNRPVCFHCGRPGHVMRYCRERRLSLTTLRNRRRNFDDVGTEEEIRRPNSSRRFTPNPREPISVVYKSPSPYALDPVSRQTVGARKTKERTEGKAFQGEVRPRAGKSSVDRQDDW